MTKKNIIKGIACIIWIFILGFMLSYFVAGSGFNESLVITFKAVLGTLMTLGMGVLLLIIISY